MDLLLDSGSDQTFDSSLGILEFIDRSVRVPNIFFPKREAQLTSL